MVRMVTGEPESGVSLRPDSVKQQAFDFRFRSVVEASEIKQKKVGIMRFIISPWGSNSHEF
jgi:hypothetical protein